jgi:hypothetical protein
LSLQREIPKIDSSEIENISIQVQETPNLVFIEGIPLDWDEEKVKNMLDTYAGDLKDL